MCELNPVYTEMDQNFYLDYISSIETAERWNSDCQLMLINNFNIVDQENRTFLSAHLPGGNTPVNSDRGVIGVCRECSYQRTPNKHQANANRFREKKIFRIT